MQRQQFPVLPFSAAVEIGVVDDDRGLHRETLQRLLVLFRELLAAFLLAEIEVADERSLADDRNREQRPHPWVIRWEAVRTRIAADVGQARAVAFPQHDPSRPWPTGGAPMRARSSSLMPAVMKAQIEPSSFTTDSAP